jgi:hypothetical protein
LKKWVLSSKKTPYIGRNGNCKFVTKINSLHFLNLNTRKKNFKIKIMYGKIQQDELQTIEQNS